MHMRHTLAATAAVLALPLVVACGAVDTASTTATPATSSSSSATDSAASSGSSSTSGTASGDGTQTEASGTSAGMSSAEAQLAALVNEAYGEAQLGLHRGHQPIEDVLDAVLRISHDELHVRMEQQGQNLAAVAEDLGIDPQTLVDALVADWGASIRTALESGAIDETQATAYTAALEEAFSWRISWDGTESTPTFTGIDV